MRLLRKRMQAFGLSVTIALTVLSHAPAQGVTQAFTFQGFLRHNERPVNATLQMVFRIYRSAADANPVWSSPTLSVSVQNGLFSVTLDPPASVWTGAPRFLEIQINPPSGPTLSPHIFINPAPYANTAALLNMFRTGVNHPDQMVITHSPPLQNWGLQYRANDANSFHFIRAGITRLRIGLGDGLLQYPWGAAEGYVLTSDASGVARWRPLPSGVGAWAVSGNNIYNTNSGNVGIGTSTPDTLLTVYATRAQPLVNIQNTGGTNQTGLAIQTNTREGRGLMVEASAGATAIYARAESAGAHAARFLGRVYMNRVRIGDSNTFRSEPLDVAANSTLEYATLRLHQDSGDGGARLAFTNANTDNNNRRWHIIGYIANAPDSSMDSLTFWNSGYSGYSGNVMHIRGDGTVEIRMLQITGADLAEKFPVTDAVEPGMVVEIDPDNPGNLRKARGAYNKRVVGVVAGANGLPKGVILGDTEGSEHHVPVALSGRVWVYADATEHAIEPGDFLTTAERPGYAMKASDLAKARGAIIGKALTRLEKGKTGMVLVLVKLQ